MDLPIYITNEKGIINQSLNQKGSHMEMYRDYYDCAYIMIMENTGKGQYATSSPYNFIVRNHLPHMK